MSMEPKPDMEVFYSYSHRDEELREELEKHLSSLKRQGVITAWHDRKIGAGTEWRGQIDTHLNTARVILLLISSDFLASDYCYNIEMQRAMERHAAGEARVIPIILRPVIWKGALFEKLQALPKDAKPVTSWVNRDEAFVSVAEGIRGAVEGLLKALRCERPNISCEGKSEATKEAPANFQNTPSERARRGYGGPMDDQTLVTCFTDLKGSTSLTQELGHDIYIRYLRDHLSVAKALTKLSKGNYIKNIGDANMVTFTSVRRALCFALQLQEFYAEQPCLKRPPFELRISLFHGIVEPMDSDVFGSGVNQAARLQGETEVSHITVNKYLFDSIKTLQSSLKAGNYFTFIGERELKGIREPPTQELFSFKWKEYSRENPHDSLVNLVFEHLQRADVEVSNLGMNDLANPGTIIWPVVPRDLATAIHRGQAEIIRLLALLGWSVKLLIADCKSQDYDRSYSEAFCNSVQKYLEVRDVTISETVYMSNLYQPDSEGYRQVHLIFRKVSTDLSLEDLRAINYKTYDPQQQEIIQNSFTLDFLRPALSVAAVLYLAQQAGQKCIVVAGSDERMQWTRTIRVPGSRHQLGFLMIPILKDAMYQGKHKSDWPIWDSIQALVLGMDSTNLAAWTFRLHAYLPAFPEAAVEIDGQQISPPEWGDEMGIPESLQKESLARHVWKYLAPAHGLKV
jgi:class 3 adenylate cyclase